MREITIALHEDVYEKLECYAKARGLVVDEAAKFLIGDVVAMVASQSLPTSPVPAGKDPWDMLYDMLAAMGIIRCEDCSKKLTAEEIKVNSNKCFACKPDISDMEF